MKITLTLILVTAFILGFLSCYFIIGYEPSYEVPLLNNLGFYNLSFNKAPSDFIDENQIRVYDDRIVIFLEGVSLSKYAPTGSMVPVLDEGSNGIRIKVDSVEDVRVGD